MGNRKWVWFWYINFYKVCFGCWLMGNDFGLENPFYKDERIEIYRSDCPNEHQMLVDEKCYVSLVRETLKSVARGEVGAIDFVMKQIEKESVGISREEVVQALLRGRINELEGQVDSLLKEKHDALNL